jgi:hypothetical protein
MIPYEDNWSAGSVDVDGVFNGIENGGALMFYGVIVLILFFGLFSACNRNHKVDDYLQN